MTTSFDLILESLHIIAPYGGKLQILGINIWRCFFHGRIGGLFSYGNAIKRQSWLCAHCAIEIHFKCSFRRDGRNRQMNASDLNKWASYIFFVFFARLPSRAFFLIFLIFLLRLLPYSGIVTGSFPCRSWLDVSSLWHISLERRRVSWI